MAQEKIKNKAGENRLVESQEDKPVRFVSSDVSFQEQRDSFVGKILEDRYEIQSFIGEGGVGAVYKAKHLLLNKTVAIKFLVPSLVKDQRAFQRFKTEAEITCNLSHQNIVTVREYGISDGNPFLVMDFIEGQSLREFMASGQKPTENRIIDWILQVIAALEYAHSVRVIHRDIKPGNIVIEDGTREVVKILDFGIAKLVETETAEQNGVTRTGELFGTPTYMSPEQCRGSEVDTRSDIYSIGCVMYELANGKPPFDGKSALEIFMNHVNEPVPPLESAEFSKSFKQAIYKCLLKDPEDRYQTVDELKNDLKRIHDGEQVSISLVKERQHSSTDNLKLKFALAASLLCCAVFAILQFSNGFSNIEERILPEWEVLTRKADKAIEKSDREQASIYLNRALASARKNNISTDDRLKIMKKLAINYLDNFNYSAYKNLAREYVNLAFRVDEVTKAEDMLVHLATYEHESGEFDEALGYLKRLEKSLIASRGLNFSGFVRVYQLVGETHFLRGELGESEKALLKSIHLHNKSNIDTHYGSAGLAHWTLSKIYKSRNETSKSFKHLKLAKDCKSAILRANRQTNKVEKRLLTLPIDDEYKSMEKTVKI